MTAEELYNQITKELSPEAALKLLILTHIDQYNELKCNSEDGGSPIMIIFAAAAELGWSVKIKEEEYVNGLICGNEDFMQRAMITDQN